MTTCQACAVAGVQEIGDLRQALNTEVDTLRSEFMDLKAALKQQLDLTASLSQVRMHA